MNLQSEYQYEIDQKDWNDNLLKKNTTTIYQTSYWQDIYKRAYNSIPFFITVSSSNGKLMGQLSGIIHKNLFWKDTNPLSSFVGEKLNLRTTLNWFHGPIIYDYNYQNEIISKILLCIDKISKENKVTLIRGFSSPLEKTNSDDPFKSAFYKIDPWATYIVDLKQNKKNLYDSFNKKTRYDIRKSEQQELTFEIANNKKSYDEFNELVVETKKQEGKKIKLNPVFFDMHREILYKKGFEKLFLVKHDENVIGGLFGVIFNGNIIQHGVKNSGSKLLGGPFLSWNSLKWAIDEKYSTFDMGGVNPTPQSAKEESIDFYKSKWGGKKNYFMLYTKIVNQKKSQISSFLKNPKRASKKLMKKF